MPRIFCCIVVRMFWHSAAATVIGIQSGTFSPLDVSLGGEGTPLQRRVIRRFARTLGWSRAPAASRVGPMRRRTLLATAVAAPFAARSETSWPTKPVRIVVPFNPGGASDAMVRVIADELTQRLGQQVLVDPKPGANTIVGSDIVAKAAPDGYTFLITTNSTHTNNPSLYAKLPFDPAKDLIPVSLISLGTILLAAKAGAPFDDLKSMAVWVKGLGRPATYGSWGIGSSGHLYGLMLEKALSDKTGGGTYSHVPYRGDVPALQDVANGGLDPPGGSRVSPKPQIAAGKIKAIAAAGSKRSASMPELSTFAEQLVPGFDLSLFVAAYAPAGTPPDIVERLQREIRAVIGDPAVAEKLIAQGQTPVGSTPQELAKVL